MPGSSYQLFFDGEAAPDSFYEGLSTVDVEESLDMPGALQLGLAVNRSSDGDLDTASDPRLAPLANVAVVTTVEGGSPECIFDGPVLAHKLHLERGATSSTLRVWGQDASWLMNMEEKVREWVDVTDATVANSIFDEYGFSPSAQNTEDDSPSHTEDGHTLMQRGTDVQFLRSLARRNGKVLRVVCGGAPATYTGVFAKPALDGEPVAILDLNDIERWNVTSLDIEMDATRPTRVVARQALFNDASAEGVSAEATDSGLTLLDERDLATLTGEQSVVLLTTPVDDGGELSLRAAGVLRESGWFVRCEGSANVGRTATILRAGTVVGVTGIGTLHSGNYLVWSVRHAITSDEHVMRFTLVRNAVGPEPAGTGALLSAVGL